MQTKQKRPSPVYIAKLQELHKVWSRTNEEINRLVFIDLDIILEQHKENAYKNGHFEAFAHLEQIHKTIKTGWAERMFKELEAIKAIPEE